MIGKARLWPTLLALTATLLVGGGQTHARNRPLAKVTVKTGYIDSHFAISPDGKHLAYLHVVSNKSAKLNVMSLGPRGLKRKANFAIHPFTVMPLSLEFTPDSRHILMFWRAKPNALTGDRAGAVFSLTGQKLGAVPPFIDFRLREKGGKQQAIIYRRQNTRWNIAHLVIVHSFPQMRRLSQHRLVTDKNWRVANPKMDLVYFIDDYLKAITKVPGKYDKKKDIRLPDREATYDMVARKVVKQRDIQEAVKWERDKRFRQQYNAFEPVVVMAGTPKRPKLELVRKNNVRTALTLDVQLARFYKDSLKQQFLPGGKALVSLTVDPQNPITLKQRKSEPEVFHLYYFTLKNANRPRPLTSLESAKQVLFWRYGPGYLAVMRLHENWTLGSNQLEIFKVASPR